MIDLLEHHGRSLGITLDAMERIGQDLTLVEAFIVACEQERGLTFAETTGIGNGPLPSVNVAIARLQAARVFGNA